MFKIIAYKKDSDSIYMVKFSYIEDNSLYLMSYFKTIIGKLDLNKSILEINGVENKIDTQNFDKKNEEKSLKNTLNLDKNINAVKSTMAGIALAGMMAITPNAQANDNDSTRIYKTASNTIEIKEKQKLPDSLLESFEETQQKKTSDLKEYNEFLEEKLIDIEKDEYVEKTSSTLELFKNKIVDEFVNNNKELLKEKNPNFFINEKENIELMKKHYICI